MSRSNIVYLKCIIFYSVSCKALLFRRRNYDISMGTRDSGY